MLQCDRDAGFVNDSRVSVDRREMLSSQLGGCRHPKRQRQFHRHHTYNVDPLQSKYSLSKTIFSMDSTVTVTRGRPVSACLHSPRATQARDRFPKHGSRSVTSIPVEEKDIMRVHTFCLRNAESTASDTVWCVYGGTTMLVRKE